MGYHFLGIGIDKYKSINSLNTPVNDVKEVAEILCDDYGFSKDDSVLFLGKDASHDSIIKAIHKYIDGTEAKDDDGNLIIYFAGHGRTDEQSEIYYWLPYDASDDVLSKENWISGDEIRGMLKCIRMRHVLLICDTCFSGDLLAVSRNPMHGPGFESRYLSDAVSYRSREVLTSGLSEEVKDEYSSSHSPMAFALIDALANCKEDWIDAIGIFEYIRRALHDQHPQYGTLIDSGHQNGGACILFRKGKIPRKLDSALKNDTQVSKTAKRRSPSWWLLLLLIPLIAGLLLLLCSRMDLPLPEIVDSVYVEGIGFEINPKFLADGSYVRNDLVFHYTLDGSTPTRRSPVFEHIVPLYGKTTVKAISTRGLFHKSDVAEREVFDYENAAAASNGAVAFAESTGVYMNLAHLAEWAIDGDFNTTWDNMKTMPTWIEVEFAKLYIIEQISFFWSGHCQGFNVYLSKDGENWNKVINSEVSNNPATGEGTIEYKCMISEEKQNFVIEPFAARFIKVEIVATTAPRSHLFKAEITEVEAWGKPVLN